LRRKVGLKLESASFATSSSTSTFERPYGVTGLKGALSSAGGWTVVDGYRDVFHPLAWYFRLKSAVKNAFA